jgi:tripeptide aminopeptidase
MSISVVNKNRLINTFKQLVRIDSLSFKEGKVIKQIEKELRLLGYRSSQVGQPANGEVGSLIVNIPGPGKCLMVNAHVDTVAPGENIQPVEKGGYIYSKGETVLGADNKAGVAVMLEVLRVIKEQKLQHPAMQFIFTVAEEVGLSGAKSLPVSAIKADYAVVLDGGDVDEIIIQAPSSDNLSATIIGRAAHAGLRPEEGVSAIKAAAEAVHRMKLGRIDFETTANIGIIKGGEATNIIPDRTMIKGEARSHRPTKLKRQIDHMTRVLKQTCARHKAKLDLKVVNIYRAFKLNQNEPIVKTAVKALKVSGIRPVLKRTGGGSDANVFNLRGIPSIIMGVGMDKVHTTAERVKIADMVKGTEILLKIIEELANV